jgi:hypothetical protein
MEGNLGDGRLRTPAITVKKLPLIKIIKNCTVRAKRVYCKYAAELVLGYLVTHPPPYCG